MTHLPDCCLSLWCTICPVNKQLLTRQRQVISPEASKQAVTWEISLNIIGALRPADLHTLNNQSHLDGQNLLPWPSCKSPESQFDVSAQIWCDWCLNLWHSDLMCVRPWCSSILGCLGGLFFCITAIYWELAAKAAIKLHWKACKCLLAYHAIMVSLNISQSEERWAMGKPCNCGIMIVSSLGSS